MSNKYEEFLKAKVVMAERRGFEIDESDINPLLKPHQKAIVKWMIRMGRAACFAAFGLGKSVIQLEAVRLTRAQSDGMGLMVIPLGVRQEFMRDAHFLNTGEHPGITDDQRTELLAWQDGRQDRQYNLKFIRRIEEAEDPCGIYLTNYETIRDGKMDPRAFAVASLDEAAILRGFGGSKTFREFMGLFAGDYKRMDSRVRSDGVRYRYVATATPSPNEYIEILAYSAFLGVLDVSQGKTRFFKRDSTKADNLTIHPHKEEEFWLWVSSWAIFVQRPSDLGYSDEGYELPGMDVHWHEIPSDHDKAGADKRGQNQLIKNLASGVVEASREKRDSIPARASKMCELLSSAPDDHAILWHDLESERHAIEKAVPDAVSIYGSQDLEQREKSIIDFSDGAFQRLAAKPSIAGAGCNFQRHCAWSIFMGIGFKFHDFIQAVHRTYRFLQVRRVRLDLIYTEAERPIRAELERRWEQHNTMVAKMTEIIKKYGLSHAEMAREMTRAIGVERIEVIGERYRIVNNDCVDETRRMEENSVGLILTSIPFSTQYEYSPNYADFGHTDTNGHFWEQMGFLIPELLRVLQPGRIAAIHVKDRIVPGGLNGQGFQTVYPFHVDAIQHFAKHGFAYMGMKTIVTDVVRENNQTYRLGWTEQCKDGSKMGVGMPEYLLLFRKPPTGNENSYADTPVVKEKPDCVGPDGCAMPWVKGGKEIIGTGYSRSRWQIDAHGYTRDGGNRMITPDELAGLNHQQIFRLFRDNSLQSIYDFEQHVRIGETLDAQGKLPVTFMLLQPQSWSEEVWTDVTRMLTLNSTQYAKGKEMHLCPMQFDIADRVINQFSMKDEVVYDPFGGLMTVPYRAILAGRKGLAAELSPAYFVDGAAYCKAAEDKVMMPSLFDLLEVEAEECMLEVE